MTSGRWHILKIIVLVGALYFLFAFFEKTKNEGQPNFIWMEELEFEELYHINFSHPLGSGKSGVYSGFKKGTNESRAIKTYSRSNRSDEDFDDEVNIIKTLQGHQVFCTMDAASETLEHFFLVMEKLSGSSLDSLDDTDDEGYVKFLVAQILVALKLLHENNIIYMALKPQKILLVRDAWDNAFLPILKLCDFSSARLKNRGEKPMDNLTLFSKAEADIYLAPELALQNSSPDFSSDMWSAGVIMYGLLTKDVTLPFSANMTTLQLAELYKNMTIMPQFLTHSNNATLSKSAIDFLHHLIKMEPAERYTVDEALNHHWLKDSHLSNDLGNAELSASNVRYLTKIMDANEDFPTQST